MVRASAVTKLKPAKSSAAPLSITVPAAIVPSGLFAPLPEPPNLIVPTDTVVKPVYVLLPERVKVPAPCLVTVADVPDTAPL